MKLRPMGTAPRDGSLFLGYNERAVGIAWWDDAFLWNGAELDDDKFDGWLPLPDGSEDALREALEEIRILAAALPEVHRTGLIDGIEDIARRALKGE